MKQAKQSCQLEIPSESFHPRVVCGIGFRTYHDGILGCVTTITLCRPLLYSPPGNVPVGKSMDIVEFRLLAAALFNPLFC